MEYNPIAFIITAMAVGLVFGLLFYFIIGIYRNIKSRIFGVAQ
jgi:hypothetical protein